jgi:hypothetical protein
MKCRAGVVVVAGSAAPRRWPRVRRWDMAGRVGGRGGLRRWAAAECGMSVRGLIQRTPRAITPTGIGSCAREA